MSIESIEMTLDGGHGHRPDDVTTPASDSGGPVKSSDPSPCQVFAFLLSFGLMSLTCAFGFVGNYLSVVTLNRDRSLRASVTKFLLTVLAVADMAFLVPVVFVIMIPAYCTYPLMGSCIPAVRQAIPYVEQYGWALASAAHMCTVYVTVLVAVHRFVHVCRPHDNDRLSGLRRAKLHVAAVPLFAFVYNLPRVFEYKLGLVVSDQVHDNNSSSSTGSRVDDDAGFTSTSNTATGEFVDQPPYPRYTLEFSAIGGSNLFKIGYKNVSFYLFMYLIPLTALIFVTLRLITTLRMRRSNKKNLKVTASGSPSGSATVATQPVTVLNRRQQSRDDNVTIVLIIIIVVFIVCQTPTLVQRFVLALIGNDGFLCGHPYYYIEKISDYLAIFNSCVNFVVYVIFAPRFRRILVDDVLSVGGRLRCHRPGGLVVVVAHHPTGRYGTGGSDYCSEMADCFGVSSSQQLQSSKENAHQTIQQTAVGIIAMKNMFMAAGSNHSEAGNTRSETTLNGCSVKVDGKSVKSMSAMADVGIERDEISSSVSSAGSSSLLPTLPLQCYGGQQFVTDIHTNE